MDERFSKELAEALLESEKRDIDEKELIDTAYRSLCHDDPLPISTKSCQALQAALLDLNHPFALSRRLLVGIDHQCTKREDTPLAFSADSTSPTSSFIETVESKQESYGLLFWTAHASIPLKCIKSKSLSEVIPMLGSLLDQSHDERLDRGRETPNEGEDTGAGTEESFLNAENQTHASGNGHDATNDDLEEVFADESDGSDFEFESDYDAAAQVSELTAWGVAVGVAWDPLSLSKSPKDIDWDAVAVAVSQLLGELRFNAFSDVSSTQWRKHNITEQLKQLTIALLVPEQNKTPVFGSSCVSVEQWQRLGLNVLHVFRDAYIHNESMLEDYLGLIRILVQLDRASKEGEICTASLAGVGALSALCCDCLEKRAKTDSSSRLTASILDACDDLSMLLEKSGASGAMEQTVFPLMEVLTRDVQRNNAIAQSLLNSGLFRQWLLRWSEQESLATKEMLNVSILELCFFSPALLGKYAWRFNGLAAVSTKVPNEDEDHPLINSFCWNVLGIQLSENAGSATVQWKTKSPAPVVPAMDNCKTESFQLFQRICQNTLRILTDWKVRRQNKIPNPSVKQKRPVMEDLLVLANRLKYDLLRKLFLNDMGASTQELMAMLSPLQALLVEFPVATTRRERSEEKEENTDTTKEELQRTMTEEDAIVSSLRKALKTILSILDNGPSGVSGSFSSKAD